MALAIKQVLAALEAEKVRYRSPDFPRGFDGHRRAQAAMGLRLSPAERLRWLEETMAVLRRWRGRARGAPRAGDAPKR